MKLSFTFLFTASYIALTNFYISSSDATVFNSPTNPCFNCNIDIPHPFSPEVLDYEKSCLNIKTEVVQYKINDEVNKLLVKLCLWLPTTKEGKANIHLQAMDVDCTEEKTTEEKPTENISTTSQCKFFKRCTYCCPNEKEHFANSTHHWHSHLINTDATTRFNEHERYKEILKAELFDIDLNVAVSFGSIINDLPVEDGWKSEIKDQLTESIKSTLILKLAEQDYSHWRGHDTFENYNKRHSEKENSFNEGKNIHEDENEDHNFHQCKNKAIVSVADKIIRLTDESNQGYSFELL